jgi:hypothetical protein
MPTERANRNDAPAKAPNNLQEQVRQAIETLGNGFMDRDLRQLLQNNQGLCHRYLGEILRIIYRILFLLFADQRGMLPGLGIRSSSYYPIGALCTRAAERVGEDDDATNLWALLQVTFRAVRDGAPDVGLFGYDGMLFEDADSSAPGEESLLRGRAISNRHLLEAIRALTLMRRDEVLERISFGEIGVEELGSTYESLLDFAPRVAVRPETLDGRNIPAGAFFLDSRGSERRTTGAYYTHPSLVEQLIRTVLLNVACERLAAAGLPVITESRVGEPASGLLQEYAALSADQRAAGERALLSLRVCDPAAGSGYFLIKADNALGEELARIRTGSQHPSESQVQAAKRDVLARCLYAVDTNPMAVELCKASLWINACVRDRPLGFLDHHIKCGNALLGTTGDLLAAGISDETSHPVTANDPGAENTARHPNRDEEAKDEEGSSQTGLFQVTVIETLEDLARWRRLAQLAEEQPKTAREAYADYTTSADFRRKKLEADLWTTTYFWPIGRGENRAPTHPRFRSLPREVAEVLPPEAVAKVEALAERYHFFHWRLEFPEVFEPNRLTEDDPEASCQPPETQTRNHGGFDVILGNPPWERLKLQEREFFASRDPGISRAPTAAERHRLIEQLGHTSPALAAEYADALWVSKSMSNFVRNSGRYPLTGRGDVNTYAVFVELTLSILHPKGRAGLVVPSGIATDYTYRRLFAELMNRGCLASLWDFENREGLFSATHRSYKYSLLVLTGPAAASADFAFFLRSVRDLADPGRHIALTKDDLALFNPNTLTCPVFRGQRDYDLTRRMYRACPVLVDTAQGRNHWRVSFLRMFDMTNDSDHFRTRAELEARGLQLTPDMQFVEKGHVYWPLLEGRMIRHFDHRAASVGVAPGNAFRSGVTVHTTLAQHQDPDFRPRPRYWVERSRVHRATPAEYGRQWLIGFKDITSSTNERTMICAVMPFTAVGNKIPVIFTNEDAPKACCLVANLNSLVLDYAARQKTGGITLNFYILEQLPVIPPERYTPELLAQIVPRVLELSYTNWDLQAFARDLGYEGPPYRWDTERRADLMAQLDAIYAHLYCLSADDLAYVLDTFPIVRRRENAALGSYRTKSGVLRYYRELSQSGLGAHR